MSVNRMTRGNPAVLVIVRLSRMVTVKGMMSSPSQVPARANPNPPVPPRAVSPAQARTLIQSLALSGNAVLAGRIESPSGTRLKMSAPRSN